MTDPGYEVARRFGIARVGVDQHLLGPFDTGPLRLAVCLGQEDPVHGLVADSGELEVCDQSDGLFVVRVCLGFEHFCPERPGLFYRVPVAQALDCCDTVLNGIQGLGFFRRCWQRDAIDGFDGAAALDEFGVGVVAELSGHHLCVADLGAWLGQIDAEGCPYMVVGEGDADKALFGPEAQGVADEN